MADAVLKELVRFETGEIDPAAFPHREHLRLGFEMLRRFTFTEAAHRYSIGLQRMTARAGRPETIARMVCPRLILQRVHQASMSSPTFNAVAMNLRH